MKKIILTITLISTSIGIFAQEAADKKIQAGLVAGYGINFQQMKTSMLTTDGIGGDITVGANVNFGLTETIAFTTGLEFDFEHLKYKMVDESLYYMYSDKEILTKQQIEDGSNGQLFQLTSRKQKTNYLTIPTMLLFRTKYIGYFRYFGKFGLRSSFLLSNHSVDEGFDYPLDVNPVLEDALKESTTMDNMNPNKNDMIFFKSAVGVGAGAEWNFTGTTTLMLEICYYYGFVNLYYNRDTENRTLFTSDATGTSRDYFNNQANQSQLMFKLSVLF